MKVATGKGLYSFDDVTACENEITKTLCAKFAQLMCQQQWQYAIYQPYIYYTAIIAMAVVAAKTTTTAVNIGTLAKTHRIT